MFIVHARGPTEHKIVVHSRPKQVGDGIIFI
jgi:hypothetical protein